MWQAPMKSYSIASANVESLMMNSRDRQAVDSEIERILRICAERGARLTELRGDVLRLLLEADGPLTAYELLDRLRETHKGAVPPTIYRALHFLMEQRLIHKVEILNAFIPCLKTDHRGPVQFLICRKCGKVSEIEDRPAARALERAAEREGFHLNNVVVEIEGTCAACLHPSVTAAHHESRFAQGKTAHR